LAEFLDIVVCIFLFVSGFGTDLLHFCGGWKKKIPKVLNRTKFVKLTEHSQERLQRPVQREMSLENPLLLDGHSFFCYTVYHSNENWVGKGKSLSFRFSYVFFIL
jgi:hypothetical protein